MTRRFLIVLTKDPLSAAAGPALTEPIKPLAAREPRETGRLSRVTTSMRFFWNIFSIALQIIPRIAFLGCLKVLAAASRSFAAMLQKGG